MQQELARAQTIAHRQRLRLTLSAITIGTLLCLLGGILYIVADDKLWGRVWAVPVLAGAFVAGLAVLPTDTRAIRVLSWISVAFWASALLVYSTQTWKALRSQNHVEATSKTAIGVCMLIYCLSGVSILCQRSLPARVAHARIWRNLRAFIGGTAAVHLIIYPILAIAAMPDDPTSLHILGVELCEALLYLLGVAASTPSRRRRAQEYMTLVGTRGEIRQAALVAKLIGGLSASEVVALARKYFRGLSFDVLSRSDLNGSADTGLFAKSTKLELGGCDAFLSHSWHDDSDPKWKVLVEWATTFGDAHGRMPFVWLDKGSIDQQNISENLACLPVYMAGCKALLVLAGPSYGSRLWCLIELFVWVRMGGSVAAITVVPFVNSAPKPQLLRVSTRRVSVDTASKRRSSFASTIDVRLSGISHAKTTPLPRAPAVHDVTHRLLAVDAYSSSCFKEDERQRLLGIIESGCGVESFNEIVRHIVRERICVALSERASTRRPSAP